MGVATHALEDVLERENPAGRGDTSGLAFGQGAREQDSSLRDAGRGGSGISDTGISGFLPEPNRREVHATAQT
jgi:hypothetical protein